MPLLDLESVVPSQVWEGLTTDQFLGAMRGKKGDLCHLASDPGAFALKELCNPFIPHMLWDPDLQVTANDV
jgi:hypothetical protein